MSLFVSQILDLLSLPVASPIKSQLINDHAFRRKYALLLWLGLVKKTHSCMTLSGISRHLGHISPERVRQLISEQMSSLAEHGKQGNWDAAVQLIKLIQSKPIWRDDKLLDVCEISGILQQKPHWKRLLSLLKQIEPTLDVSVVNSQLHKENQKNTTNTGRLFFVRNECLDAYKKKLTQLVSIACKVGVAHITERSASPFSVENLYDLINSQSNSCVLNSKNQSEINDFWFAIEFKTNSILSNLEKIQLKLSPPEHNRASACLTGCLKGRTPKHQGEILNYPPEHIVFEYLKSSTKVKKENGCVSVDSPHKASRNHATKAEDDLILYLNRHGQSSFKDALAYLLSLGHQESMSKKTINFSPFVFVDKTNGRRLHRYELISAPVKTTG